MHKPNDTPKFITISGMEGTGKSTIIEIFKSARREDDKKYPFFIREPEDPFRRLVVEHGLDPDPFTEMLIYMASKSNSFNQLVVPAMKEGRDVYADRWYAELWAFQCFCKGVSSKLADKLNDAMEKYFQCSPTHQIILTAEPETSLSRSKKRLSESNSKETRFEDMGVKFHSRVKEGFEAYYNKIKNNTTNSIILIDTENLTIEETYDKIKLFLN